MTRNISSREAGKNFDAFLDDLSRSDDVAIVERDGAPVAVVISIESYRALVDSDAERDWQIIDRLRERNREVDNDRAEQDIAEAIAEVRRARRQTA